MEIRGKLNNIRFTSNENNQHQTEILLDGWLDFDNEKAKTFVNKDIVLKLTKYSERRSLDANAYCWKLCTLLAEVLKTSKDEVYEHFIREYGYTDDEPIVLTVKSEVDMDKIDGHWKYLRESKDGRFKAYMRLRGTSEYNTKEMAHFLDMVVEECKENGVETMTPEELMKLKQAWGTQGGIINE